MADSVLTYLSPGWTEGKLKNATDQDYESLTEEQLQKVMDHDAAERHAETLKWFDEKNTKRIARGAKPIPYPADPADDQPQPSQQVVDPATDNLTNLPDHVEQSNLDIFGFCLFRTYHGSDEQSWDAFEKGFWKLLDEGIAAAPADFNLVEEKVFIRIVSDDSLEGQSIGGVLRAYYVCMEEDEDFDGEDENDWGGKLEPGLTTSMCLVVDEECIRSVLDKATTPFVKAVDVTREADQTPVKVAITSLVPAFYAALSVYSPKDVASKVSEDGIWRNMGPGHGIQKDSGTLKDQ